MPNYRVEMDPYSRYTNGVQFFLQNAKSRERSTDPHIHTTIEFIFVKSGSYIVYTDDNEYEIFAGDVILFHSNVMHHIFAGESEDNSYYVLRIKPDVIRDIAPSNKEGLYLLNFAFKQKNSKCLWRADESVCQNEIPHALDVLKKEFSDKAEYCDIAVKLAAGSIILALLRSGADSCGQSMADTTDRTVDYIYKAMNYINNNYEKNITASDVCSVVNMSYSFFSRSFKRVTGKTYKQYLNQLRVNHAEQLLATTDKSVKDICFECGFNDVSYFVKVYREHKQKSPGSFRATKEAEL